MMSGPITPNKNVRATEVAKLHSKISNRRNAYQWQVANKLVRKADAVVVEDLNIQGMVRRCKPKPDQGTGRFLSNGQSAKRGKRRVPGNLGRQLELFSQDMWDVSSAESPFF